MSVSGRHSLCLCGPGDGLGACDRRDSSYLCTNDQQLHHLSDLLLSCWTAELMTAMHAPCEKQILKLPFILLEERLYSIAVGSDSQRCPQACPASSETAH